MKSVDVCPVKYAAHLDSWFRRLFHNPARIVGPYVKPGMTAMDIGCGPGFFSIPMADMVGPEGRVIAADMQEGMLDIVRGKIAGTPLADRIVLHRCEQDRIGFSGTVDFALAFYVVHEVPDAKRLFAEVAGFLKPGGCLLVVEPPFHVGRQAFEAMLQKASLAGLTDVSHPNMFPDKCVVFRKD